MLELYVKEGCPYCAKVIDFFDKNGVEYETKFMSDPENLDFVIREGGKNQAPFLVDLENHNELYESNDIIDYVKFNVLQNPDL